MSWLHLWTGAHDLVDNEERYQTALNAEERVQYSRFPFKRERRQYLLTRIMERTILARYLGCLPFEVSLVRDKYGKPTLHQSHNWSGLNFNLSHCEGFTVFAISHQMQVGVDVESIDRVIGHEDTLLQSVLSPKEQAGLTRTLGSSFIDFWTLKEAFAKATGRGLSEPFDKIEFLIEDNCEVRLRASATCHGIPESWKFLRLVGDERYLVALAIRRHDLQRYPLALGVTSLSTAGIVSSTQFRQIGLPVETRSGLNSKFPVETIDFEDFVAQTAPKGSLQ